MNLLLTREHPNTISLQGPRIWNSIPPHIKDKPLHIFKQMFHEYLVGKYEHS